MKYTDPKFYWPELFLTEEQRAIQKMVHAFVDKEIMPVRDLLDDGDEKTIHKIRQGLVDRGLVRYFAPKKYGGEGRPSAVTNAIIVEELARGDMGIAVSYTCILWTWAPALALNMEAVLDRFMPDFCGNEVRMACFNMTEPGGSHGGGGCDIENPYYEARKIRTIAKLEGNEWVINGSKLWATNSGDADLHCVVCTVDPNLGLDGIVFVYVPYPWEGFTCGPDEKKAGCSSDRNCATYFDNVRVPKEWGIGPGGGVPVVWERQLLTTSSTGVGNLQGAFETLLDYTGERICGNKPIRQHSSAALILGRMATVIQMSRIFYLTLAYMADHPQTYGYKDENFNPALFNMIKSYAPKAACQSIDEAMILMGSFGYSRGSHLEKYWRDAKIIELWLGGNHINTFNVCRGYYDLEV